MIKWKRIIVLLSTFFFLITFTGCTNKKVVSIDPFKDIQIKEKGWNQDGYLEVEKGDIPYHGNDQTILKLIDSIRFDVKPNKKLKNGDEVTIELKYDKELNSRVSVHFTKEETKYKLTKLVDKKQSVRTEEKEVIDKNGEKKIDISEYIIIDGVEIPTSWNLTNEEMQDYIQYIKNQDDDTEMIDEPGVKVEWIQGTSETKTNRKDAKFYMKDYGNLDMDCYNAAYEFGNVSSQQYKIRPIVDNSRTIGYECVFKQE